MHTHDFSLAFYILFFAGFTDALDGFLARKFGWASRFGGFLDPIADKLLMFSSYVALSLAELLPWWISILVIARDSYIIAGATYYHFFIGKFNPTPTQLSKLTTVLLILLVLLTLSNAAWPFISGLWINSLIYIVAILAFITAFQYTWIWTKKALETRNG